MKQLHFLLLEWTFQKAADFRYTVGAVAALLPRLTPSVEVVFRARGLTKIYRLGGCGGSCASLGGSRPVPQRVRRVAWALGEWEVDAVLNGHWERLRIVGVALSPEYVYEIRGTDVFPDDKRFGVLWMSREAMGPAIRSMKACA